MPSAVLQVVPNATGDFLAGKVSGALAPASEAEYLVGFFPGFGILPQIDGGWMARFELPIPDNATITGVSVQMFVSNNSTTPIPRMTSGLLAPDGVWNVAGGRFTAPGYPTLTSIPWPERDNGTLFPSRWHLSIPAFALQNFTIPAAGQTFSFGDGLPALNPVTGLVASFQNWLTAYGPSLRGGSVSGSDLPVAICFFREYTADPLGTQQMTTRSSQAPVVAERPTLTISWSVPEPASVKAKPRVCIAVRTGVVQPLIVQAIQTEQVVVEPIVMTRSGARAALLGIEAEIRQTPAKGVIR